MIAAGPPAQSEVRSDRPFRRSPVRGVTRGDIGRNLLVSHRVVRLAINRLESAHRCDIDPALQVPAGPPAVDPSARPQGRGDIYELALQRSGGGGVSHHSPAFESRLSLSNCRCCPRPRPGWRTARDALTLPGVAGGDRSGSARGGTRQPLRRYSPRRASRVGPTAITLVARQVWVGVLIGAALRLQPGPARCHLEASSSAWPAYDCAIARLRALPRQIPCRPGRGLHRTPACLGPVVTSTVSTPFTQRLERPPLDRLLQGCEVDPGRLLADRIVSLTLTAPHRGDGDPRLPVAGRVVGSPRFDRSSRQWGRTQNRCPPLSRGPTFQSRSLTVLDRCVVDDLVEEAFNSSNPSRRTRGRTATVPRFP